MSAPRVIRLTEKLLADLPVAVQSLNDEIDYLDHAIDAEYPGVDVTALKAGFKTKHDSLVRARDWLVSKVEAETHRRTEGADDVEAAV